MVLAEKGDTATLASRWRMAVSGGLEVPVSVDRALPMSVEANRFLAQHDPTRPLTTTTRRRERLGEKRFLHGGGSPRWGIRSLPRDWLSQSSRK
jgi:hypothetical protein